MGHVKQWQWGDQRVEESVTFPNAQCSFGGQCAIFRCPEEKKITMAENVYFDGILHAAKRARKHAHPYFCKPAQ